MKVIFICDVTNVAKAGDIKNVPDGYARNYLLPKKLAVLADSNTTAQRTQALIKEQREAAAKQGEMNALAKEIDGKEVTLKARAGKEKLFGSVTSADISAALERTYSLVVDKKKIELPEPIHQLGSYEVVVKLGADMNPKLKVNVVEETEKSAE
ncbi:MAG: 50S ribosomal protein L9 [Dehalococcoidales bacterium]|nr:50S ribosomal protein L9 [Dehalococcoidales bacterium]